MKPLLAAIIFWCVPLQLGCVVRVPPCRVTSAPQGAHIKVNGLDEGTTPCDFSPPRTFGLRYTFEATLEGYQPQIVARDYWPESMHFNLTPNVDKHAASPTPIPNDCDLGSLPESKEYGSVAVLDFLTGEEIPRSVGESLADFCRQAVQQSNRYTLVDRAAIKALLSEEDFAASTKCDETRCLVDFGKKLRAQKMVHGRVAKHGELYVLAIKMVDVSSGAIEAIQNAKVKGGVDHLIDFVEPTTCQLIRQAVIRQESGIAGSSPE